MAEPASTGTPVDTESVAAFLRAHPRFLADRLELYREIGRASCRERVFRAV